MLWHLGEARGSPAADLPGPLLILRPAKASRLRVGVSCSSSETPGLNVSWRERSDAVLEFRICEESEHLL